MRRAALPKASFAPGRYWTPGAEGCRATISTARTPRPAWGWDGSTSTPMKTNADLPRSPAVQRAAPFSGILPVDDVHMIDSSKLAGRSNAVDGPARAESTANPDSITRSGLAAGPSIGSRQEDTTMIQTQKASPRATVLVVDDDESMLEYVRTMLELDAY